MKNYTDKDVVPQNLFAHKTAQIMSGLMSNVEMMIEDIGSFPNWAEHELAPGYNTCEALNNMKTNLIELRKIHKEFVKYLDDNG